MSEQSQGAEPRNDEKASDGKQQDSQNKNEENKNWMTNWVFYSKSQPPKCDSQKSDNSGHDRKHNIKWWFEIIGICFEVIGIIVAVWVAFLVLFQYREMVKSTKVFEAQLGEMQKNRVIDERAWVTVSETVISMSEDRANIFFHLTFKNTGKTPALNSHVILRTDANVNDVKTLQPLDIENSTPPMALIPPNGITSSTIQMPYWTLSTLGTIYLFGTAWYDDIFGTRHWTTFCYTVSCDAAANVEIRPAHIGNSCDDAKNN